MQGGSWEQLVRANSDATVAHPEFSPSSKHPTANRSLLYMEIPVSPGLCYHQGLMAPAFCHNSQQTSVLARTLNWMDTVGRLCSGTGRTSAKYLRSPGTAQSWHSTPSGPRHLTGLCASGFGARGIGILGILNSPPPELLEVATNTYLDLPV